MSYPFYDLVNKNIKNKDLTKKQKESMIKKITQFDKNGKELLYAIIKVHYIKNSHSSNSLKLPFNGQINDDGVIFKLDDLPFELRQILNKFVNLHFKQNMKNRQQMKKDKKDKKGKKGKKDENDKKGEKDKTN